MNVESLNPVILKKVIALLERREELQKLIEEMNHKIASLISAEEAEARSSQARKGRPASKLSRTPKASGKRGGTSKGKAVQRPYGSLKRGIIDALRDAGPLGCSTQELSRKLEVPSRSITVWFSGTGKKLGLFGKNTQGLWILK